MEEVNINSHKFLSKKEKKIKEDLCEDQIIEAEYLTRREQSTNNGIKSGRFEGGEGRYRAQLLGIYA